MCTKVGGRSGWREWAEGIVKGREKKQKRRKGGENKIGIKV